MAKAKSVHTVRVTKKTAREERTYSVKFDSASEAQRFARYADAMPDCKVIDWPDFGELVNKTADDALEMLRMA
jgi:hypothetical protein